MITQGTNWYWNAYVEVRRKDQPAAIDLPGNDGGSRLHIFRSRIELDF